MADISDADLRAFLDSAGYFPASNYTFYTYSSDPNHKRPAIDELMRVIPFEAYEGDDIGGIRPSGPKDVGAGVRRFLPSDGPTAGTGAGWVTSTPTAQLNFTLEAADAAYETFNFRRVYSQFSVNRRPLASSGRAEDYARAVADIKRLARLAVLRQLGRDLINSTAAVGDTELRGLAGIYDGQYATGDPQVIGSQATGSDTVALLREVRKAMRQVTPSHDGFGAGPNALVMSRRCRDWLLYVDQRTVDIGGATSSGTPLFLPDPTMPGELRYHHNGVPVYVAPVREDEDQNSTGAIEFQADDPSYVWSSMYAMRLGGPTGVRVLYQGGDDDRGVTIEDVSTTGSGEIVIAASGRYALYIPEHEAVARLWKIDLTNEPDADS